MNHREWKPEEYAQIRMWVEQGMTLKEIVKAIAGTYHVSNTNAKAALRRAVGAKHGSYQHLFQHEDMEKEGSFSRDEGHDFINIVCASDRVLTKEDIIKQFEIDTTIWEIDRFKVKTSEGYRKDRKVKWEVENGKVLHGSVDDTGKMLVVPLYHIEVHFNKRKDVAQAKSAIADMIEDAKKFAPHYPSFLRPDDEEGEGYLAEISMFDVHFGRLTWSEESGGSYDIKIARKVVMNALEKILSLLNLYNIKRIILPIGNDWFNSDNKDDTTTRGTPQQEDTRWQKTFRAGREVMVEMIDACTTLAPVDVLVIPGNHDLQRSFYLGEALTGWYHNNPQVTIDNRAAQRKYYRYGKNLIGFTHGSNEKLEKLPTLMALEQPKLWAQTEYREWHTGDKHHRKDFELKTDEGSGVVVRILSSLAEHDAWTYNTGFKSIRAAQAFLWHPEHGLVSQFTAVPDEFKE